MSVQVVEFVHCYCIVYYIVYEHAPKYGMF